MLSHSFTIFISQAMLRNVPCLKPHHIDEPIVEKLNKMSQPQAFEALAELARNNLATVRADKAFVCILFLPRSQLVVWLVRLVYVIAMCVWQMCKHVSNAHSLAQCSIWEMSRLLAFVVS